MAMAIASSPSNNGLWALWSQLRICATQALASSLLVGIRRGRYQQSNSSIIYSFTPDHIVFSKVTQFEKVTMAASAWSQLVRRVLPQPLAFPQVEKYSEKRDYTGVATTKVKRSSDMGDYKFRAPRHSSERLNLKMSSMVAPGSPSTNTTTLEAPSWGSPSTNTSTLEAPSWGSPSTNTSTLEAPSWGSPSTNTSTLEAPSWQGTHSTSPTSTWNSMET